MKTIPVFGLVTTGCLLLGACAKDQTAPPVTPDPTQQPQQPYAQQPQQYPQQQQPYAQQPQQYPQQQQQPYAQQPQQYPQQQQQPYAQPAPAPGAMPAPAGATGGQMATPGPLALPCQNDSACGFARCNVQFQKCAFPCQGAVDCGQGNTCNTMTGLCLPGAH